MGRSLKNGCEIKPFQDIGEVAPLTHFKRESHNLFKNATVIGMNNFKSYYACTACDTGEAFLIETTEPYVRCNSCGNSSHVRHSSREISAYLTLQNDDSVRVQLTATSTTISKIARKAISDITQYTLLDVPKFNVEYLRYQSIVDVSYPQRTSSPKRHARRNLFEEMASEGQQSLYKSTMLAIKKNCKQQRTMMRPTASAKTLFRIFPQLFQPDNSRRFLLESHLRAVDKPPIVVPLPFFNLTFLLFFQSDVTLQHKKQRSFFKRQNVLAFLAHLI